MNIYYKNSLALACLFVVACSTNPTTTHHLNIPYQSVWQKLHCEGGYVLEIQAEKNSVEIHHYGRNQRLYLQPSREPLIFSNGRLNLYYRDGQSLLTDFNENILLRKCR